jgi:hypothetical protein
MAPDTDTQDGQQTDDEKPYVRMKREDIQALEQAAQKAKDMEGVQRELAMTKAGVDTDTPMGKMFFKAYDGELTKDAIITAAQEVGLLDKTTQNPDISKDEKDSTSERQTLNNGATPPGENPTNPKDEAVANAKKVIDDGGKYEQAAGAFLTTLVQRYADGDTRAARNPNERFKSR